MDTRVFCVYNLARGGFISTKLTVADTANEPLKMLDVLIGSKARDTDAGLWLTPLYAVPMVPRLFPFDLVYLDNDHRVLEFVEIVHGVQFPDYSSEVASALVLPLRSMATTKTHVGDRLIVCPQEEMERRLAAVDAPVSAAQEVGKDGPDTTAIASSRAYPPLGPERGIPGDQQDDLTEPGLEVSAAAETTVPARAGNGMKSAGAEESIRRPAPLEPTSKAAADSERPEPAGPAEQTPGTLAEFAIFKVEPESSTSGQTQKQIKYDDPSDIFANWVASPFSAPAWLEPRLEPVREQDSNLTQTASAATPVQNAAAAAQEQTVAAQPAPANSDGVPANPDPPDSLAAKSTPTAPSSAPAIPQPPQKPAFTIAQYGMWRITGATGVRAVSATEGTRESHPRSASIQRTETRDLSRASGAKPEGTGALQEPLPTASPNSVRSEAAKPAVQGDRARDTFVGSEPISKTARAANPNSTMTGIPTPVQEVSGHPGATKDAIATGLRSEQQKLANDTQAAKPEPGTASPIRNGAPTKQPESNGTAPKQADELTMTVSLPRFRKPDQKGQTGKLKISIQKVPGSVKSEPEPGSLKSRVQRWLNPVAAPSDRRRAYRRYVPGVSAYYFSGGAPKPHEVADISMSGFYLITEDRWMPGTMIQMTLQKPCARGERKQIVAVLAKIVRKGVDGVGAEFVMPETLDQCGHAVPPERATDRFSLARFL